MDDRYAALAADAEREEPQRPTWSGSAAGDQPTVVGEVVEYATVDTQHGPANLVALRQEDGEEIAVWLSRSVLRSQFEQWQPQVGELVAIAYLGEKQGNNGAYHNYKVKVEGRSRPARSPSQEQEQPQYDASDAASEVALQAERDAHDADLPF